MISNTKEIVQSIPIAGNILTKFARLIKYSNVCNRVIELYYHLCSIYRKKIGVTFKKRTPQLIISLTTISSRIDHVYLVIETLLQQSVKPDYLILWLSETNFSTTSLKNHSQGTRKLLNQRKRGLKINFCKDIRSYTKILYTLKHYPDAIVVSADDDLYYPKNWLKELYNSYNKNPEYIHCHASYIIKKSSSNSLLTHNKWLKPHDNFQGPSPNIFPLTGQGCLFPPGSLHQEVFNENVFLKISPYEDDAWFKAMSILNNVPAKRVKPISKLLLRHVRGTQSKTLCSINIEQGQFDPQFNAILKKYDLIKYIDENDVN
ncbi:hypothetical protein ACFL3O_00675 [Candidatus Neomarinimicrobiota bacterium]